MIGRLLKRRFLKPRASHSSVANFILASNDYGAYCIPASAAHRPAAKYVMAGDVWERDTIEFMVAHANTGDVVTAGAFFGDALPALSRSTTHTVWAFEPNPESYRCAAITVLLNDLKNVRLLNAGLGETSETRKLVVRDFAGRSLGGASKIADVVDHDGTRSTDTVSVSVVAVDDTVPSTSTVSLMQLDIEGFEEFALAGAFKTIERSRPLLILETVPKPGSKVDHLLQSLGYKITRPLDSENVLLDCR
jgi:FkbM family methyltransferase